MLLPSDECKILIHSLMGYFCNIFYLYFEMTDEGISVRSTYW